MTARRPISAAERYTTPAARFAGVAARASWRAVGIALLVAWWLARTTLCALLVLIEPLLGMTLVPLAFLGFVVTLVFGFLAGDPSFPKWGMLCFSVGMLWLYWLFLALMSLLLRLP